MRLMILSLVLLLSGCAAMQKTESPHYACYMREDSVDGEKFFACAPVSQNYMFCMIGSSKCQRDTK
jgi:hypothetical protein